MTCQRCGTENPSGNRFCIKCGTELTAADQGVDVGSGEEAGAVSGAAGSAYGGYAREETSGQPGYEPPAQGAYAPPGAQPGGYSNPYSAPPNPSMAQQGYAYQGEPGMVWRQDQLVGFGPRLGAYILDWIILTIAGAILNVIHLGGLDFFVGVAYFGYFWSTTGQSLGMQALGMKVVRTDGQPVSAVVAIVRYLCYFISAIPFLLGFLWIIWDPKKQGFHDKIVGTVVVRA